MISMPYIHVWCTFNPNSPMGMSDIDVEEACMTFSCRYTFFFFRNKYMQLYNSYFLPPISPLYSHPYFINPYNAEIFYYKPWRPIFFTWNHHGCPTVSSFRFIWIPMVWVYGHYTFTKIIFNSFNAGIEFRRENATSMVVRHWRL